MTALEKSIVFFVQGRVSTFHLHPERFLDMTGAMPQKFSVTRSCLPWK
jgi:hypothetical protein